MVRRVADARSLFGQKLPKGNFLNQHLNCTVSKKNWNTKENKGKSMMHVRIVHIAVGEKTHFGTNNVEEINPVALSIVEFCLAGGIS